MKVYTKRIKGGHLPFIFVLASLLSIICTKAPAQNRVLGADLSLLPAYEAAGTAYYPQNGGNAISDVLSYVKTEAGMNAVRVRLFVGPDGTDPSVCQDLNYVKQFGKRIKDAGLKFLLDFHYSDSWADPANQTIPKSWYNLEEIGDLDNLDDGTVWELVNKYTADCLKELVECGAYPDYVQIGNEISYGMLWRKDYDKVYPKQMQSERDWQWERLAKFLDAGARAVRSETPNAKIIIHTERVAEADATVNFYTYLKNLNVDYDIIGLSYYPFYHGDLSQLKKILDDLQTAFPQREVHIVETAYVYSYYPADAEYDLQTTWPATSDGQQTYVENLVTELCQHPNVTGLYWWFAEENGNGSQTKKVLNAWLNRGLWNNSTHRALPALYKMKNFLTIPTSIVQPVVKQKATQADEVFDLSGRKVKKGGKGIYIGGGVSFIVR